MSVNGTYGGEQGGAAGKLLEPGDMFGDYTVEKLLGKGGMGAVYLVRAPGGERYAVKLMFPEMVKKGSDYRKRFAREAEFAMKIKHKNLISVYDVGEDPETGLCYIIMDYVPGGSVADRLAANGALPIAEAVSIAAQIALALELAHRHGVVHRDIKPDNIMFDADGTPKLADLGVAKFTDGEHRTTVTTTGMIIGTPAYMAPEQMMDSHHVDARADIYALGVVLYEMLTGKRPNAESTAVELLAKAIKGEPLPDVRTMRPEVSAAVAHVLSLMCAPKPENRPATALAAAQLLRKAASGKLVLARKRPRSSAAEAAALKAKRRRLFRGIAVGVGMAAFLLIGIFGWIKALNRPEPVRVVVVSPATNMPERVAAPTNVLERAGARTAEPAYVSRSALHAAYRSKERKRVFVEIPFHDGIKGFESPPCTLDRLDEAIAAGVDIIWMRVDCTRDGVLHAVVTHDLARFTNGKGTMRDFTAKEISRLKVKGGGGASGRPLATFEELLRRGKGKVFFKFSWPVGDSVCAHAAKNLLNRLDAWESVICEVDDSRALFNSCEEAWSRIRSGELQIMIYPGRMGEWANVTEEYSVWSRSADLGQIGLVGIPQRIETYFGWDPGEGRRTNDEAGWRKALSEGVTIFRTRTPKELVRFLSNTGRTAGPAVP